MPTSRSVIWQTSQLLRLLVVALPPYVLTRRSLSKRMAKDYNVQVRNSATRSRRRSKQPEAYISGTHFRFGPSASWAGDHESLFQHNNLFA